MRYIDIINSNETNRMSYDKNEEFPPSVILGTTEYCNLKCNYCGHPNMTRKKGVMSIPLYKKIIDEVSVQNPYTDLWMVYYGEALMLKYKMVYMIQYAKKQGLKNVFMNTNGILLDTDLSEAIIDSGLDKIIFSLDAYYEESYKKIRNNDNFELVKKNIKNFIEIKKRLNSDIEIEIQLIEIPGLHKQDEIELFEEYWNQFDVVTKRKEYLTWMGAIDIDGMRHENRHPCSWLFRTFVITYDGKVNQCGCDYDCKVITGDLKEDTIQNIWRTTLKKTRDLHLEERYNETSICENCKDWDSYKIMSFLKLGK